MPTLQKLTSFSLRLCASAVKSLDFVFPESPLLADTVEKLENQIELKSRPVTHFSKV